ncbi:MAG: O-antigen ligase family protein [Mycobacterium sp.]
MLPQRRRTLGPDSDIVAARGDTGSWIIATAAFLLVSLRQTYVIPGIPLGLGPGRFVLFACAGWFIFTRLTGHRSGYRLGAAGPVVAVFFTATLTAYGIGMTRASVPVRPADTDLVVEIMLVLTAYFFFTAVHDHAGLRRIVKALVAGAVVSAVFAIVAHFTGSELAAVLKPPGLVEKGEILNTDLFRGDVVRPQGSADHPLELAAVLAMIFPLAVGLTYSLRAGGQRWRPWAVAAAIVLGGVAVSVSRSALAGLFATFVFMALYWPIRRTLLMFASGVVLAALVFAVNPPLFKAYSVTLGMGWADPSAQYRVAAARYIMSHFSLFGSYAAGAGTSGFVIFDNQYLHHLSGAGIVGLVSYVVLLATAFLLAFRAYRYTRTLPGSSGAAADLYLGLAASFVTFACINVFLDVGGFVQIWTTMWLLIATAAVAFRISREQVTYLVRPPPPARADPVGGHLP